MHLQKTAPLKKSVIQRPRISSSYLPTQVYFHVVPFVIASSEISEPKLTSNYDDFIFVRSSELT